MSHSKHLRRKLQDALGQEAAENLVTWIDQTDSLRGDVAELRQEMDRGFARVDSRFKELEAKFDTRFAEMDAKLERRFADLIKWSFVFWVGAVGAIAMLANVLR